MMRRRHDGRFGIGAPVNSFAAYPVVLSATIIVQPPHNRELALQGNRRPWRPPEPIPPDEESGVAISLHGTRRVWCVRPAKLDSFTTTFQPQEP